MTTAEEAKAKLAELEAQLRAQQGAGALGEDQAEEILATAKAQQKDLEDLRLALEAGQVGPFISTPHNPGEAAAWAMFASEAPASWLPTDDPPWEPSNGRYWFNALEERDRKEIALADLYSDEFNHGTTGHMRLNLIAQLAEIADRLQWQVNGGAGPGPGDLFTGYQRLPVKYNPQWGYDANRFKKDCGPACIETLCEFYRPGTDRTTDEIMAYITGGVDRPTSITELQKAASELYQVNLTRYNGATVYNLLQWLDAGRPIIVLVWYGGFDLRIDQGYTGGHFWVVVGYERFMFEGKEWVRIIIHDPDYYGARHVTSGAFLPVTSEQFRYVWDNAHNAWGNPDNVALVADL